METKNDFQNRSNLSFSKRLFSMFFISIAFIVVFALVTNKVYAQDSNSTKITGVISEKGGMPLIGATVVIKGTQIGTVTDVNGKFVLDINSSTDVLVISYLGFETKEIVVEGQAEINVTLAEDEAMLDDVVVVGYGSMDKKELTSAVAHISSDEFLNVGGTDPAMQIQGKIPGVNITNIESGNPNSEASIQIRGVSSRSAGLGPLVVIDGVPGGSFSSVSSNDIKSIDVLKDGAASAIYGTRGSNGVILITTKSGGKNGKTVTEYNGYFSVDLPQERIKTMNASDFRKYKVDSNLATDFGANTDWMDEITQVGYTQNHILSMSGGQAQSNYRLSLDVKDATGIDIRSDRLEYKARLHFQHTTKNGLFKFSGNVSPRVIKRNNSNTDAFKHALTANPTMPVKNLDDISGKRYTKFSTDGTWNPVDRLNLEKDYDEHLNLNWNISTKLNLLPLLAPGGVSDHSLNTQITLAQVYNNDHHYYFLPTYSTLAQSFNETTGVGYGSASQDLATYKQESLEWMTDYKWSKNDHNLGVMGGYSYQQFMNYGFSAENKQFSSDGLTWDNLGNGEWMKEDGRNGMGSYRNSSKLIAFFGRVTYDYKKKYLMTASLRYEGSSKFGDENKWGYFPAVSAGWRISDEDFMASVSWIDDLKLRADFGVTGNQDFDNYQSIATYGPGGDVYYDGQYYTGWGPNKNPNPNLKWEKGLNWNVGADFSLFKKLSGSLNYYNRTQQDLLGNYNVPLPPYLFPTMFVNVGTMVNTGFEFTINYDAVKKENFSYSIGFVGATQSNKFKSFSNSQFTGQDYYDMVDMEAPGKAGPLQRLSEGERVGTYYTWKYAGLDNTGDWLVYNNDNEVIPIADATDNDKRATGNGLPKFTMSLNNYFRYKNFDLTLYFRGAFGYQLFDVHEFYYGLQNVYTANNVQLEAFTSNGEITGQNLLVDYFIKDAGYLKLDVVTLGYNINLNKRFIDKMRIYGTARNLFTITKFDGVDPSVYPTNGLTPGTFNGNKTYYPSSIQLLLGVQVNF